MFTALSSVLIIVIAWYLTDRVIESRLKGTAVDGDVSEFTKLEAPPARAARSEDRAAGHSGFRMFHD